MSGGPPVSVMGATVFTIDEEGAYVVGSMTGLYSWDRVRGRMLDLYTGRPPKVFGSPLGEFMIAGCLEVTGKPLCADYERGMIDRGWERVRPNMPPMPAELSAGGRISLWHALFEFHNGRFFAFLLGWWNWIVVPFLGLGLAFEAGTGLWDRLSRRARADKASRQSQGDAKNTDA